MTDLPADVTREVLIQSVDWVIRNRYTEKVLLERDVVREAPLRPPSEAFDEAVRAAIAVSGWAPFHYDRREEDLAEPWRYYRLDHAGCGKLADEIRNLVNDMRPQNKIPKMLAACGCLIVVTWLPEETISDPVKKAEVDSEHAAACAAAVQSLLLALTARGLGTYWSSGGNLRDAKVMQYLGIDLRERLMAAVFVDDREWSAGLPCERIPGKNRAKRSGELGWLREVKL